MTTPKTKDRNLPHINATVDKWQDDWIRSMVHASGLSYSRIVREIINVARRYGYTPGNISLSDLERETAMRTKQE